MFNVPFFKQTLRLLGSAAEHIPWIRRLSAASLVVKSVIRVVVQLPGSFVRPRALASGQCWVIEYFGPLGSTPMFSH